MNTALRTIIFHLDENEQMSKIITTISELRGDQGQTIPGAEEKAAQIEAAAAKLSMDHRMSSSPIPLPDELIHAMASLDLKEKKDTQTTTDFKEKFQQQLEEHEKLNQNDSLKQDGSSFGKK